MSNITNSSPIVTEDKLKDFYEDIKPFLGCPAYVTQEGDAEYYSTDEKVIGRWTDGKPLYQKVYSGTTASSGVTSFSIVDLSIDKVIDVSGYVEYATNNFLFLSTFTNANDKGIGYASRINAFIDTSYTSKPYAMILKYTKTTDSASTTIQEDPNEYSTNEKIIGKWIDGKPLYQKTFTGTGSSDISLGYVIDLCVDIEGFFVQYSGGTKNCMPVGFKDTGTSNIGAYSRRDDNTNETVIRFANSSAYTNLDYYITVKYTKTTD